MNPLNEICKHCGCTFGSHHRGSNPWPYNYCPGHEGRMDWEKGPGTVFGPTGTYKDKEESEEAKERRIAESQPSLVEDKDIDYVQVNKENNAVKSFRKSFDKCAEDKWASGMVQGMSDDRDIMI